MPISRHAPRRPPRLATCLAVVGLLTIAACSTAEKSPTPSPSATSTRSATPAPTPSPTALPTPKMTNQPDPELESIIPGIIAGAKVIKPAPTEFAVTPGNFGEPFGDVGLRFQSLVIAYVERPRLSLYAARADPPAVATASLKPFLAAAGEYVGIAGLHPEAWKAAVVGGHQVWTRGDDEATLPGTTLYCWSSGPYVFLLIGSSDAANRQMVTALPGEPAPTPTPRPTGTPGGSPSAGPSASGGASGAASAGASPSPG